jgi:hypothetical protein
MGRGSQVLKERYKRKKTLLASWVRALVRLREIVEVSFSIEVWMIRIVLTVGLRRGKSEVVHLQDKRCDSDWGNGRRSIREEGRASRSTRKGGVPCRTGRAGGRNTDFLWAIDS